MRLAVLASVADINPSASPGFPYACVANKNSQILDNSELLQRIVDLTVDRLFALSEMSGGTIVGLTPEELVERSMTDIMRVFIKNEPHSEQKILEGRGRIIMSVSISDQLIDRVLHKYVNKAEIEQYVDLPAQCGMGTTKFEQIQHYGALYHTAKAAGCELHSSDVSGWDWSVNFLELLIDMYRRIALAGVKNDVYAGCCLNRLFASCSKVFMFSDGTMVAQKFLGGVTSGSYLTGSSNSWVRYLNMLLCGVTIGVTMGDDAVDSGGDMSLMGLLGHKLKAYVVVDEHYPPFRQEVANWISEEDGPNEHYLLKSFGWIAPSFNVRPFLEFCSTIMSFNEDNDVEKHYIGYEKMLAALVLSKVMDGNRLERFLGDVQALHGCYSAPLMVRRLLRAGWFDHQDFESVKDIIQREAPKLGEENVKNEE